MTVALDHDPYRWLALIPIFGTAGALVGTAAIVIRDFRSAALAVLSLVLVFAAWDGLRLVFFPTGWPPNGIASLNFIILAWVPLVLSFAVFGLFAVLVRNLVTR